MAYLPVDDNDTDAQQQSDTATAAPSFISDADMAKQTAPTAAASGAMPDFLSDADMAKHTSEHPFMSALREAYNQVIPTIGALPAISAGARIGGMVGGLPGAFIGGAVGGLGGGYVLEKAQGLVKEALGINDDEQRAANAQANPNATMAGGLIPMLGAFGIGRGAVSLGERALNAVGMGGITAAQELYEGQDVSAKDVGVAAATGAVFAKPRAAIAPLMAAGDKFGAAIGTKFGFKAGHPSEAAAADGTPDPEKGEVQPEPAVKTAGTAAAETPAATDSGVGGQRTEDGQTVGGVQAGNRKGGDTTKTKKVTAPTTLDIMQNGISSEMQQAAMRSVNKNKPAAKQIISAEPKERPLPMEEAGNQEALQADTPKAGDAAVGADDTTAPVQPEPVNTAGAADEAVGADTTTPHFISDADMAAHEAAKPAEPAPAPAPDEAAIPAAAKPTAFDPETLRKKIVTMIDNHPDIPEGSKQTLIDQVYMEPEENLQEAHDRIVNIGQAAEADTAATEEPIKGKDTVQRLIREHPDWDTATKTDLLNKLETVTTQEGMDEAYKTLRSKGRVFAETGVMVRDKGDLKRKQGSLDAVKKAFDAYSEDTVGQELPISKADKEEFIQRVQGAWELAKAEFKKSTGGADPLDPKKGGYKPNTKNKEWQFIKLARDFLAGKPTPAKIQELFQKEQELWHGGAEDLQADAREKADRELRRSEGDANEEGLSPAEYAMEEKGAGATDQYGKPLHGENAEERAAWPIKPGEKDALEGAPKSKLIKKGDKVNSNTHTLDLDNVAKTPEGKQLLDDMTRVAQNLAREEQETPRTKAQKRAAMLAAEEEAGRTGKAERSVEAASMVDRGAPSESIAEPFTTHREVKMKGAKKAVKLEVAKAANEGRSILGSLTDEERARYGIRPDGKALAQEREKDIPAAAREGIDAAAKAAGPPEAEAAARAELARLQKENAALKTETAEEVPAGNVKAKDAPISGAWKATAKEEEQRRALAKAKQELARQKKQNSLLKKAAEKAKAMGSDIKGSVGAMPEGMGHVTDLEKRLAAELKKGDEAQSSKLEYVKSLLKDARDAAEVIHGYEGNKERQDHFRPLLEGRLDQAREILDSLNPPAEVYVKPKAGQEDTNTVPAPKAKLDPKFLNDKDGSLNLARIDSYWKTHLEPAMRWLGRTVGHFGTDKELDVDSRLAMHNADLARVENWLSKILDARWHRFLHGATVDEQVKYQLALENSDAWDKAGNFDRDQFIRELTATQYGIDPKTAEWMADEAKFHHATMDGVWEAEKRLGSKADYVKNYISHLFKDEKRAREYIQAKIDKMGPDWFTKERTFARIKDAMDAGFELKYNNPIDVLHARVRASLKYQALVGALHDLQKMGVAVPADEREGAQKRWQFKFDAADGQRWYIDPTVETLVNNAITSVGLRDMNNSVGNVYRAWMNVKNTFIPIKLAISAFHWVHVVLNVNLAANVAREITRAAGLSEGGKFTAQAADEWMKGGRKGAMPTEGTASLWDKVKYFGTKGLPNALKISMTDPLYSLPIEKFGHPGKVARTGWDTPDDKLTPMQQYTNGLLVEGGGIPHRNAQDMIQDTKNLHEALHDQDYIRALPLAVQAAVKKSTAFMFEQQIPNLKTAAYLRDVAALFERRPDLVTNERGRREALRALMQSNDNRFGEMFYNNVFMNKIAKDVAIGSTLSLGWNLGQVREFGGAAANIFTGKVFGKGTRAQQLRYAATNKGAYTAAYTATSMLSAAGLSYALSGVFPSDWKDYFFPRVGGIDAEGQPRRLTTPFNTREPIMLKAHMDSEGPVGGLATFLYNKMVLSPVMDVVKNHDYFGNELYDTNAPWYKQAYQLIDSMLGENLNPIVATGYQRGREQGGGAVKSAATSFAGFGPAPAYVNRTPFQRKLTELYNQHYVAQSRPYQDHGPVHAAVASFTGQPATQAEQRAAARAAFNQAYQAGDTEGMQKARGDLIAKGGMSPQVAGRMEPGDADKRKFARLPIEDKLALARQATPEEYRKYVTTNPLVHRKDRGQLEALRNRNQ